LTAELLFHSFVESPVKTSSITDAQKAPLFPDLKPLPLSEGKLRLALVQAESDRLPRQWTEPARVAHAILSDAMTYLANSCEVYRKPANNLNTEQPEAQAMIVLSEAKRRIYLDCPMKERRNNSLVGNFGGYERRKKNQN
jgi:hypothetical protein